MATTPARNTRRDPQTGPTTTDMGAEVPLGGMRDRTFDRPVDPIVDRVNNVNIRNTSAAPRSDRGFGATFAIAAAVLLVAFLVALYLGTSGSQNTPAPDGADQSSTTETAPGTTNQATGSDTTTTTLPVATGQITQPGTDTTGTNGSTGTANP